MKCERVKTWFNLYVDARLGAERLAPLEAHLETCATCRQELAVLEAIAAGLAHDVPVVEPEWLTSRILARVAAYEAQRSAARTFTLRWSDTLLAALLASITTLLFVLLDPNLRASLPTTFSHSFPALSSLLATPGPGSIAWVAWFVWVAAGMGLALVLAGAEVRSAWRRSLSQRLPQLPQLRQP
jgi:anti-sigma factor RsiW